VCSDRKYIRLSVIPIYLLMVIVLLKADCDGPDGEPEPTWSVTEEDSELLIGYGSGTDYPQYAVLHLYSSYFRMVYGRESGWGTSIILMPCFWAGGKLYQGELDGPLIVAPDTAGPNLVISFTGKISSLVVDGDIVVEPPTKDSIRVTVTVSGIEGDVTLDDRPGEAFKPVMFSSMHISEDDWDARFAYVDGQTYPIPEEGWIIEPPVEGTVLGLKGGTSDWKVNAPTIEVTLDRPREITGWVTRSSDPNDDNVGFWAATDEVIKSWRYEVVAKP
jgi:hypothetical protein